jgi:hypothetical protein
MELQLPSNEILKRESRIENPTYNTPISKKQLEEIASRLPGKWRDNTGGVNLLYNVAQSIYKEISSGKKFATISVDHTSGHFPGVFVDQLLFRIQGSRVPHCNFALTRKFKNVNKKVLEKQFEERVQSGQLKAPVLVVTDLIFTGSALEPLLQFFKNHNIDFKVVAVGATDGIETKNKLLQDHLINNEDSGATSEAMINFYGSTTDFLQSKKDSAYAHPVNTPTLEDTDMYKAMVMLGDEFTKILSAPRSHNASSA